MRKKLAILALSLVFGVSGAAFAGNGNGKGPPHDKAHGGDKIDGAVDLAVSVAFGTQEARIIRDYFSSNVYEMKPLPPGIAKNLARGKPLPPGIAKRYLPLELSSRLPVRADYERLIAGDDVLLVSLATGVIVDILNDVL
ncbi:anti-virulence regulator CigR family protein [Parvibaculum sp.]|uniref:anti-virulence regulator CigR family protein n=1 Tax=Parvibaculum sp. TaxID=2024848 RepID=UPI001B274AAA|nr:anti-virulence regulator CigR family protein [Parvibaculum sp.]MBO6668738.1 hypothetical protein [Parvibaculum sp.]MBO6691523.1 hypothetical protein [Parvibaculum sp.]MBO6714415.1 hypothetical protein [Parvibaculum sp.]